MTFFPELEQKVLKFVWKHKRHWITKAILRKKSKSGAIGSLTLDYTTKLQASKQYGIGTQKKNPEIYINEIGYKAQKQTRTPMVKAGKIYSEEKDSLFNKWYWENWTAKSKRMK